MNPEKLNKMLRIKCTGCGGCCTSSIVPVTDADVLRIMKRTGKTAQEIIRFYDSTEIDYDTDSPSWIKMNYGKRIMGLKKKQARCQFLDDNSRCTIYTDRPATCRTFPLQVARDDNGRISNITLNRIIKDRYPFGAKNSYPQFIRHANMEENEDEFYSQRVSQWNKKSSRPTKSVFLKFLKLD